MLITTPTRTMILDFRFWLLACEDISSIVHRLSSMVGRGEGEHLWGQLAGVAQDEFFGFASAGPQEVVAQQVPIGPLVVVEMVDYIVGLDVAGAAQQGE